ncbi:hypothetical protein ASPWEDRAFT_166809 [Aspergillus wentii DTO 134E9]|uniref:C2H2-type domain-containing protein n=1 Tax=Aspergillus wentii DTO 134E9 TaxID=1073089 RepID=A0A1L9S0P3_ASPWE|nr:uncharacterized protein ASPWEDRAFT_166809 [Aspergillus wentii DTO 134E9]KAI9931243.1 hypothetical protein MW887_010905 [Aspergillus wentii]OJJ40746.1 hypothetical protein ASPWEDRAFT_166809 [Aspergillus wentii DTO 134E9]
MDTKMQCLHCSQEFTDQLQLAAHYRGHEAIQRRRQPTRIYGLQYVKNKNDPGQAAVQMAPSVEDQQQPAVTPTKPAATLSSASAPVENAAQSDARQRVTAISHVMTQENSLLMFRRFSELNIRNLLVMQKELARLDGRVKEAIRSGDDTEPLEFQISEKLHKYNKTLLALSQLQKFSAPEDHFVKSLRDWADDSNLLSTPECDFLADVADVRDDLLALNPNTERKAWVYRTVEALVWRFVARKPNGGKAVQFPHGGVLYTYDDDMVAAMVRLILTLVTSVMLIIPIIILYFVKGGPNPLIIVTICTLAVAVTIAMTTDCKNHEILMAAAAYGAVMIVYLEK